MTAFIAALVAIVLTVPEIQRPPRDPSRPAPAPATAAVVRDTAALEAELAAKIAASPATLPLYYELSRLQERRGAFAEAEATLQRVREAAPSDKSGAVTLAGFYTRRGLLDQAIAAWETAVQIDGSDPQMHMMIANAYLDKVNKDKALAPSQRLTYVSEAIAATDRALALDADSAQALNFKSGLLKHQATLEPDPVQKQKLLAEAETLIARAKEANVGQTAKQGGNHPYRPATGPVGGPDGMAPVRVGGHIKVPTKVRDVRPVYPPTAQTAGIQGVIVLEATVAADGRVSDAKVLRSIPLLDEAAIDAVRQWEFAPTLLNGVPVPVIMTVTVNFSLQ